jgi:hypothetical protein
VTYDVAVRTSLRWVLLFVIGAAVGTALDHLHVSFGVLDYPGSWPFAQRPWVPPLFGGATVSFVLGHQAFRVPGSRGSGTRAILAILLFAAAYFCSAAFHEHPKTLLALMTLGFTPFVYGQHYLRRAAYALSIGLGGMLFETALVTLGGFRYLEPGLLPVPIWLPGLYLYGALAARELDLAFFMPAIDSALGHVTERSGT